MKNYFVKQGPCKCKRVSCGKTPLTTPHWGDYEITKQKNGTEIRKPTGQGCGDCNDTYFAGFENYGDRDQVLELCNTDKDMEKKFADADYVRTHPEDTKPFYGSDVKRTQSTGVTATLYKRGLTPEEFEEVFTMSAAEAKKPLSLLRTPEQPHQLFQGILLKDHKRLQYKGVLYTHQINIEVSESEEKMNAAQQLYEDQSKLYFEDSLADTMLQLVSVINPPPNPCIL